MLTTALGEQTVDTPCAHVESDPLYNKEEKDCQSEKDIPLVDLHLKDFEGDKKGLNELNPGMKFEIKLEVGETPFMQDCE